MPRPTKKNIFLERLEKYKAAAAQKKEAAQPPAQDLAVTAFQRRLAILHDEFLEPIRKALDIDLRRPWSPPAISARENLFDPDLQKKLHALVEAYIKANEEHQRLTKVLETLPSKSSSKRPPILSELEIALADLEKTLQKMRERNKRYVRWKKI